MTTYTIKRASLDDEKFIEFMNDNTPAISRLFGSKFNYFECNLKHMVERGLFLYCERDEEITGILLAYLTPSIYDEGTRILQQQLFYVKPGSGRTAYHLFQKFIDIGKQEANHIITMLTSHTNIKPSTLEGYGFKELETLYRLEVQ